MSSTEAQPSTASSPSSAAVLPPARSLAQDRVLVVGGSRGLGLGLVEALVAHGARVTVVARGAEGLAQVKQRHGVEVIAADATEPAEVERALREVKPSVVVVNAGAPPVMRPLHEMSWEDFSTNWQSDTRANFFWVQAALRGLMPRGGRMVLVSSGAAAAPQGSPLSGGYAAAKRMAWWLASYANLFASERDLGLRFQVIVPRQMVGGTGVGDAGSQAYARRRGIRPEDFLASFGAPLTPRAFGEGVVQMLTEPEREQGTVFAIKGGVGLSSLDP